MERCLEKGILLIEGDIYSTHDGRLVVIHDRNLSRLCGENNNIEEIHSTEMPNFLKNIDTHFWKEGSFDNPNEHSIDLLEDFFKSAFDRDVFFILEIKTGKNQDFEKALNLVNQYNLKDRVFMGFAKKSNSSLLSEFGKFKTFVNLRQGIWITLGFFFGTFHLN